MNAKCYSCAYLMRPDQSADGIRRCRADTNALPVSPALEADCKRYLREPGSDDQTPEWYRDAWHIGGAGRGD